VRNYRGKAGYGFNLEQQIASDLGMFARISWSDGNVEEVDFADINLSASLGLAMTGAR
jgi:high affinity Mn2+ porin